MKSCSLTCSLLPKIGLQDRIFLSAFFLQHKLRILQHPFQEVLQTFGELFDRGANI